MPQLTNPSSSISAYADRLRQLMSELAPDPLSERKTIELLEHIVNNRGYVVYLHQVLDDEADSLAAGSC
ncbi:Uncharacterised protein [Mycobacteroides abscessus subsp. abscessus]|nr:Uncharacterised protein [Mycobacteroides abscessus subsp. abscessus]SLH38947.1 Uncharacterised protein [Mycobacteroides abscessus subsp. abscessus]